MNRPLVLAIVGPTACGKTEIGLEISKHLPVEIISCDSMQVYKSMPILSQAPPKSSRIHLVSFLEPSREYSAALFRRDATQLIREILRRGRVPVLVGGTGLYLRSLLDGLFESGVKRSRSDALRRKLIREQEKKGGHYLHDKLKAVDPESAEKIHPNDIRRLVRALEVFYLTKKTMSEQKPNRSGLRDEFTWRIFLLEPERADLYERVNKRVDRMILEGLAKEVKKLSFQKLSRTAGMALGFREIRDWQEGRINLPDAIENLKKNTRRYAKRQISWFRHEKGIESVAVPPGQPPAQTALEILRRISP